MALFLFASCPPSLGNTEADRFFFKIAEPLSTTHHGYGLPVPIEVRPHVGTALAADPTGEALLDIGQSGIIGPGIAADRDGVATAVVGAIDQQAANAHLAHLAEGDLLLAVGHGA